MGATYKFLYETEANASYLVAELGVETPLVQYQIKMLENNRIIHLLDLQKYQQNETVRLRYNVTGRMSLAQIVEREKIRREEFLTLLSALLESYGELSEYQLSFQGLLLNEESVFIRNGGFEPDFIYLPVFQENDGLENLRRFVRDMVMNSRLASTGDDFIQRLLDTFNRRDLTLETLRDEVERLRGPAQAPRSTAVEPPKPPVIERKEPVAEPKPQPQEVPEKKVGRKAGKPSKKPKAPKEPKPPKEKSGSSKTSVIFTALQAAIVLGVALAAKSGFFFTAEGTLNISYIAGILLAVAGLDFVVYRELFVNNKDKTEGKKAKKAPKSAKTGKKAKQMPPKPGAARHPETEPDEPQSAPAAPVIQAVPVIPAVPEEQPVLSPLAEPEEDHTVVMGTDAFGAGYLEYFENGLAVRIHLDRDVTRVGSRAQSVDHVLLSHKVSKVHAEFIRRGGRYFVRDINSTNGTYINEGRSRIVSNQEMELHNGDRIRLADVELTFKC